MQRHRICFHVAIVLSIACVGSARAQSPSAGLITSDDGGASGYQHSLERSRFRTGAGAAEVRRLEEHGFAKMVGTEGVFATDLRNGLVVAVQSRSANKGEPRAADAVSITNVMDPNRHNEQVVEYFVAAGIPRDQVGGIHANTYLSSSGSTKEERAPVPKVEGYASILERKIEQYAVVDSIAWARMTEQGNVISEWVYWPAIPAKILADARRLEEQIAPGNTSFWARLPSGLPPGKVVIRHSAATAEGPFEVYASYDVVERTESTLPARDKNLGDVKVISVNVRHFDVDGDEIRLPQERRNNGADFPPKKK
jgi:hypothetical protein